MSHCSFLDEFCGLGGDDLLHVPSNGPVGGRGAARFRTVQLGGPRVRKARCNLSDPSDGRVMMVVCIVTLPWLLCLT